MAEWVVTESLDDPSLDPYWVGEAKDAMDALDQFAAAEGFCTYTDAIKEYEEEQGSLVGDKILWPEPRELPEGALWAIFTNTTVYALPVNPGKAFYLSVRIDGEEVQGYSLYADHEALNSLTQENALNFALDTKDRFPESEVAIHILTEAPKDKEDSMSIASKDVTEREIKATIQRIESGLEDWRQGRNASPDDRDHVIDAITVLGHDWHDHEELVEEIANEIYEDAGLEIQSLEELATFCLARLKDEGIVNEEPMSEYLVHINIQIPREKRVEVDVIEREIKGALEVGLGSEMYAPNLMGAEVEIALAEEIG